MTDFFEEKEHGQGGRGVCDLYSTRLAGGPCFTCTDSRRKGKKRKRIGINRVALLSLSKSEHHDSRHRAAGDCVNSSVGVGIIETRPAEMETTWSHKGDRSKWRAHH